MESGRTKADSGLDSRRAPQKSKTSSGTLLSSISLSLFGSKKTEAEKRENEEVLEKGSPKKVSLSPKPKPKPKPKPNSSPGKVDRDLRRFKVRYNTSIGNIMRNWMSLMYSILILRLHLIKFILTKFPDMPNMNKELMQQILIESKVIYHMIRKAQHFSQERSVYMWSHLENLIFNRMMLKSFLEASRKKDSGYKDWKGMASRLKLMQTEYDKVQNLFETLKENRGQKEKILVSRLQSLENLNQAKEKTVRKLAEQIVTLKKNGVEVSCRILSNLKACKDLSARKKYLGNLERDLVMLKNEWSRMNREYSSTVDALQAKVEEKDKEIESVREEKKNLKKALKSFDILDKKIDSEALLEN